MDSKLSREVVLVVASKNADSELMQQLVTSAGFDFVRFTSIDNHDFNSMLLSAIVVCHRVSEEQTEPALPKYFGQQRLLVFSDVMQEKAIVNALESGAHHVFNIDESPVVLQARLNAALRKHAQGFKRYFDVAPYRFDTERRNVYMHDKLVNLSPKEYEFVHYLFINRHRVVVNTELMTSVWSLPSSLDARRIDTAACRVRKKMQLNEDSSGWCLRRLRRVGYELVWVGENSATSQGVQNENTLDFNLKESANDGIKKAEVI